MYVHLLVSNPKLAWYLKPDTDSKNDDVRPIYNT